MAVAAIMGTMSPKAAGVREADSAGQVSSRDTNTMPWEIRHIDELDGDLAAKQLIEDLDTGMSVMKMKYFAGFTNEWHTHPCAHGMYVLDGVLKTHAGSLGPGSFVWFPAGMEMEPLPRLARQSPPDDSDRAGPGQLARRIPPISPRDCEGAQPPFRNTIHRVRSSSRRPRP
jgi:hypothetical protein